jgi:hypothetical protein
MATKGSKTSETSKMTARQPQGRAAVVVAPAAVAPARSSKARRKPEAPMIARSNGRPSHDQIAQRAYELFEQRGCAHGDDLQDWLRAEAELAPR